MRLNNNKQKSNKKAAHPSWNYLTCQCCQATAADMLLQQHVAGGVQLLQLLTDSLANLTVEMMQQQLMMLLLLSRFMRCQLVVPTYYT